MPPFLAADLGNSSLKLGLVEDGRVVRVERLGVFPSRVHPFESGTSSSTA